MPFIRHLELIYNMNNIQKIVLTALFASFVAVFPTEAKQNWETVPGKVVDHNGLIINPTPQIMLVTDSLTLNTSRGFTIKDKRKAFWKGETNFLHRGLNGIPVIIDFGKKPAEKANVRNVSGAYSLKIEKNRINITGFDELGAWYGLVTLRQMLEKNKNTLPLVVINDFPELKYRGVVEGFYGTPWSHATRLSLIDFMGRNKMNNYIFGPKDDPYHNSPHWRQPYPEKEARQISELVEACRKNRVQFIWAIHPGQDIRWNKEDYDSLINKLNGMYDLGIRQFAIFFDDIDGEGTNSEKQAALVNDLTRDFVKKKGDVGNIMICPTDYSQAWAKPGENGQLAVYGRELLPEAEVFWTGSVVCSDIDSETLDFINSRIKRPALVWWNYPVSDYCREYILQGPVYGLQTSLTSAELAGIETNPMEHGEASKLALYGVADWAWNPDSYNPLDNWERGFNEILPDAAEAYRTFAIHSADTETGYRRAESWETETFDYNNYTPEQFENLKEEFKKIAAAPSIIESSRSNPELAAELKPWLDQFAVLGNKGLKTLTLIKAYESGDPEKYWNALLEAQYTPEETAAYKAHRSGTLKLMPWIKDVTEGTRSDFYRKISGKNPRMLKPIGTYPNLSAPPAAAMVDNDTTTYYHSGNTQHANDWIGVDLGEKRPVHQIRILQGRNEGDVDAFNKAALEISDELQNWTTLTDTISNKYDINWKGDAEGRYVRLRRLPESDKTNWTAVREFEVDKPTADNIGTKITSEKPEEAVAAFDGDPATATTIPTAFSFDRNKNANQLLILSGEGTNPLGWTQLDGRGRLVGEGKTEKPFEQIPLHRRTKKIQIKSERPIYELIQK